MNNTDSQTVELVSQSVEQTMRLGAALAQIVELGDMLALSGQLGAGKTQFVRGFAAGLGADERLVSSPTFVLMSEYSGRLPVVHIDAYRMNDLSDLESIGWSRELLHGSVTLVEWAERLRDELPNDRLEIAFEHAGETQRRIEIVPRGRWRERSSEIMELVKRISISRSCPICQKAVSEAASTFPFCSSRCKLAELNKWFKGDYNIPAAADDQDDSGAPGDGG